MKSKLYAYFKNQMHGDYKIWLIVMILNAFGMVVQFSAKGRFNMEGPFEPILGMIKPLVILFISFWVMAWVSRQDYVSVIKYITLLLFLSWGLILFAYFFGTEKGGASRWVDLGPVSFMPSDMAKLCLTISLAKMFSTRQANPAAYTPWVIFLMLAQIGITCFLVMLSNVSTSGIIFTTSLVVMVFGRVPWKSIGIIFCIVAALAVTSFTKASVKDLKRRKIESKITSNEFSYIRIPNKTW
jgi:cell division protein FtsW